MPTFSLKISFDSFGTFVIREGQCWLARSHDSQLLNSFFGWLDMQKFHPEASIEFIMDAISTSDLFEAGKYFKTLRFSLTDSQNSHYYYQQRYHSTENDYVQTLGDYLGEITDPYLKQLALAFGLDKLINEKINMLSTGEFRKAYLLKSSASRPPVMFLDDPCTGIDKASCILFNQLFRHLVNEGTSVVIFTACGGKPDFITHALDIGVPEAGAYSDEAASIAIPEPWFDKSYDYAFELRDIVARYNGRDVLHKVSWSVVRGEKWSLTGHNGAGKSTLLSFVYADNPQVYSNNVILFGRRRGTGESVWEIKDLIGFYSSELHRYFDKIQTVESAINSIVYQNPYEKRQLNIGEEAFKHQLLGYFNLDGSGRKLLCDLPAVTQKLVLLVAVLTKNAPLLILDEPFQGFSEELIRKAMALIVRYITGRTFIMVSHNYSDFEGSTSRHYHLHNGAGWEIDELTDLSEPG